MLYIVTALYEEALPFIKIYCLKRKLDFPHFELFGGEEVLLLITRPGALRAATALSSLLTAFPPDKHDLLLSVGCHSVILSRRFASSSSKSPVSASETTFINRSLSQEK